jgi:hypothetical protein
MGLQQIPAPVAGAVRNVQVFLSSTTWTVPSSAKYVDVMVVGGGCGGAGGHRRALASNGFGGYGGGIILARDVYLGGTGTVAVTIGSGSAGTTGTATTTAPANPSAAGFSAFGNIYASGAVDGRAGVGGYKGTLYPEGPQFNINFDTNQSNWGPAMMSAYTNAFQSFSSPNSDPSPTSLTLGLNAFGLYGGGRGYQSATTDTTRNVAGASPGGKDATGGTLITTNTIAQNIPSTWLTGVGSASSGTSGTSGGAGGAAGITGIAGGGGTQLGLGQVGGQGGPGAGGGGSMPASAGGNGGNGGNAGANTGAGGGTAACTGNTTGGTGGNGGNGGSGLVVVSWIS